MNDIDAWLAARDKISGPFAFIYTMIQQLSVYCNILNSLHQQLILFIGSLFDP